MTQGLVTVLKQFHDELDAAVLEACGWQDIKAGTVSPSGPASEPPLDRAQVPADKDSSIHTASAGPLGDRSLPVSELPTRLVALNHERAAEERQGQIRWPRPDYQNPVGCGDLPTPISPTIAQPELAGTETSEHSKSKIPAPLVGKIAGPSHPHPQSHWQPRQ
ncbi:MAG: hypothetical protein K9N23_04335 [Akkermansiaceae bacterium]|nr:hypothetical protein [Akkermansiaceae bacterium]MCF7730888.1 hypothetical protein [Akkermansiaceae bacterium]